MLFFPFWPASEGAPERPKRYELNKRLISEFRRAEAKALGRGLAVEAISVVSAGAVLVSMGREKNNSTYAHSISPFGG